MKLKTARKAIWISFGLIIVFALILIIKRNALSFILLMCALAAYLFLILAYMKCPHCDRHVYGNALYSNDAHCPHCGKKLYD